jgi:hypothetical protein
MVFILNGNMISIEQEVISSFCYDLRASLARGKQQRCFFSVGKLPES